MALEFDNATFGYDPTKLQSLIEQIRIQCIENTRKAITNGLEEINAQVDNSWVGASAKAYKQKFQTDSETVNTAITTLGTKINEAMANTGTGIKNVDESITF